MRWSGSRHRGDRIAPSRACICGSRTRAPPARGHLLFRRRPIPCLACGEMAPLITFDEALALGELTSQEDILALVERAWEARQERFGDSTDLCSLVNAKSGGCAEDCGFCAQSRYAEADTPMHAMME